MNKVESWTNLDKADWILQNAKIKLEKIDFHNAEGKRAEHMQNEIIDILAEYFDDNWIDTAYIEEEINNYIDPVQQEWADEQDRRYQDEIDRRLDL